MKNLVNALDRLKNALDAEVTLRQSANIEFARGQRDGPMKRAHDVQLTECIDAAKLLVQLSSE
jgi:hypothetical protein